VCLERMCVCIERVCVWLERVCVCLERMCVCIERMCVCIERMCVCIERMCVCIERMSVWNVCVEGSLRQRGVGGRMMASLHDFVRDTLLPGAEGGVYDVWLDVDHTDTHAGLVQAFYRKHGYEEYGGNVCVGVCEGVCVGVGVCVCEGVCVCVCVGVCVCVCV